MISFRRSALAFALFTIIGAATANSAFQNLRGGGHQSQDEDDAVALDRHRQLLLSSSPPSSGVAATGGVTSRSTTTTYYFTTRNHKISYLCWPGNTQEDATTKYQGRVCGDGYTIIWDSMKTVANPDSDQAIKGADGQPCQWSRSTDAVWNAEWLGSGCGVSPNSMALPRNVNDKGITTYWQTVSHQDPTLCWDASNSNANALVQYEATMCPNDHSKRIWNSMMTIDANQNAVVCSNNGLKAVWSRHDYDPVKDAQFLKEYFGDCGVAPTKFPNLKTTA